METEILKALREVAAQLGSLEARMILVQEELHSNTKTLHRGNGAPALTQRVAHLEDLAAQHKTHLADTRKIKFAAITSVIAAAGSLASRLL